MANLFNNFNSGFHKRAAEILGPAMDKRALDTASQYALATALGGGAGALGGYYLTPEEEEENQTRNALLGALAGAGGGAALNYGLTRGAPAAPVPNATNVTPTLRAIIGEGEEEELRQLDAIAQRPKVTLPPERLFAPTQQFPGPNTRAPGEMDGAAYGYPSPMEEGGSRGNDSTPYNQPVVLRRGPGKAWGEVPVETYLGEDTGQDPFFGPNADDPSHEGYVDRTPALTALLADSEASRSAIPTLNGVVTEETPGAEQEQQELEQRRQREQRRKELKGELDDARAIGRDLENNPRSGRARGAIDAREDRLAGEARDEAARLASEKLKATRETAAKARIQADLDQKNKLDAAVAAAAAQRAVAAAQRAAAEAALDKAVKNYPK